MDTIVLSLALAGLHFVFREGQDALLGENMDPLENQTTPLQKICGLLKLFLFTSAHDNAGVLRLAVGVFGSSIGMFCWGASTNSLVLMSGAFCLLSDMIRRILTVIATITANWQPDTTHTYGFARYTVLAMFLAILLIGFFSLTIWIEAFGRYLYSQARYAVLLTDSVLTD